jgi:uncharacterized protein YukE
MSNFVGMDPGAVRQVGSGLKSQSHQVEAITSAISSLVHQAQSAWHGGDSTRFAQSWASRYRPQMDALREWLDHMATSATANATQQEQTSSGGGGSHAATGGHGGGGGSVPDLAGIAQDLQKLLIGVPGLAMDAAHNLIENLPSLKSAEKLMGVSKVLRAGGIVFGVADIALTLTHLKISLDAGDDPAVLADLLDLTLGTAASVVPFGGLAWEGGKLIGEGLYNVENHFYDVAGGARHFGAIMLYGPGVDMGTLTSEQIDALNDRYDGPMGVANSIFDHINGAANDASSALGVPLFQGAYDFGGHLYDWAHPQDGSAGGGGW